MSRKTILRTVIGVAISGIAIWILARSVDVPRTLDVLRTANPAWILLMVGTVFLDVAARGGRWHALLMPIKRLPYRRVLGYTYLGYLANNVLPARLGELVRSHALGEGEGVSRPTVLGTVVVERIVDTVIVVVLAALAVVVLGVSGVMSTAVVLGAGFVGLLIVGLSVAMVSHRLPGAEGTMVASATPLQRSAAWLTESSIPTAWPPAMKVAIDAAHAAALSSRARARIAGLLATARPVRRRRASSSTRGYRSATAISRSAPGSRWLTIATDSPTISRPTKPAPSTTAVDITPLTPRMTTARAASPTTMTVSTMRSTTTVPRTVGRLTPSPSPSAWLRTSSPSRAGRTLLAR